MPRTKAQECHFKNCIQPPSICKALSFLDEQNERVLKCVPDFERKKQLQGGISQIQNKNNMQEKTSLFTDKQGSLVVYLTCDTLCLVKE